MTAEPSLEPLRHVLVELDGIGLVARPMFLAWIGTRAIRVVEILDTFVLIQALDDPRSWELVAIGLIRVDPHEVQPKQTRKRPAP